MSDLVYLRRLADIMAAEHNLTDREDAVQEATIAAWMALEAGKPEWAIYGDMRRRVLDIKRGRSALGSTRSPGRNGVDTHGRYGVPLTRTTPAGEVLVTDPVDPGAAHALERAESPLFDALRGLPVLDRSIAWLRYAEGYSINETAAMLDISTTTLTRRWKQTRPILQERLAA